MKEYLLSVIIPVYNVEKYIEQTVKSVLNQTFTNSEIVIVDDGSVDNSVNIVKALQKDCDRIKIIEQKNSGASAARNRGIEEASGKYIIMMDSDDTIEPEMHEYMIRQAEEKSADMVICNFSTIENGGKTVTLNKLNYPYDMLLDREYIEKEVIYYSVCKTDKSKFVNEHCTVMLKREILINNDVRYNEHQSKEEDKPFLMHCLKYAQSLVFVEGAYYNYFKRPGSLISRYSDRFSNFMTNFELYEKWFGDIYDFTNQNWLNWFVNCYEECIAFVFTHKRNVKSVKQEIMKIISNPKSIEKFSLVENGYDTVRKLYSNGDYNGIYKYYKKKFINLRIKIFIRDILITLKLKK